MTHYQQCVRCVMDTLDPDIVFDRAGVCHHCRQFDEQVATRQLPAAQAQVELQNMLTRLRAAGRGRRYDCVLGISGGADSSYLAWWAWQQGLRTLLVHMDNGWDSELAVQNIENIVRKTGFDYYNHVVDWDEFRDLQVAYLRASVVDVEVVTDHAITALVYRTAARFGVRHILGGSNFITESIMPRSWSYDPKSDLANLRAIHHRYGTRRLKSYPTLGLSQIRYFYHIRKIHIEYPLNCLPYRLPDAMRLLETEFDWRYYGGKHWESLFTKFYQAHILPVKFNADKRKSHLSNLVCAGQLSRAEALQRLANPVYPPADVAWEYDYVLKKLGLSLAEFTALMAQPPVPHSAFPREARQLSFRLKAACWKVLGKLIPN